MARKKRQGAGKPEVRPSHIEPDVAAVSRTAVGMRGLTLRQYLVMNVVFDSFCLLQLVFTRLIIKETRGLYFFFGLLMIGFLAISIFDYVYDRVRAPDTGTRDS